MKIVHFDDLGYTVTFEPNSHWANFKVFQISAWSLDHSTRYYGHFDQELTDTKSADVFMSGSIKWDGCANVQFDEQKKCMLHFCGKKDFAKLGALFDRLYDEAFDQIEKVDKSIFFD